MLDPAYWKERYVGNSADSMSATGGISLQYFISIAIAGEVGSGSSPDHAAKNLRQKNEGNQINQPCNVPLVRIYKIAWLIFLYMHQSIKNLFALSWLKRHNGFLKTLRYPNRRYKLICKIEGKWNQKLLAASTWRQASGRKRPYTTT